MIEDNPSIMFYLDDNGFFKVTVPLNMETQEINESIQNIQGELNDDGAWRIPFNNYQTLINYLEDQNIRHKKLPSFLRDLLQQHFLNDNQQQQLDLAQINYALDDFQRESVEQAIRFQGKILIADDLGVGKSRTAITIANLYRDQWPLLIICPPVLRIIWRDQIMNLLGIHRDQIQIIVEKKDQIQGKIITIISYNVCSQKKTQLKKQKFKVGIADECYFQNKLPKEVQFVSQFYKNANMQYFYLGLLYKGNQEMCLIFQKFSEKIYFIEKLNNLEKDIVILNIISLLIKQFIMERLIWKSCIVQ